MSPIWDEREGEEGVSDYQLRILGMDEMEDDEGLRNTLSAKQMDARVKAAATMRTPWMPRVLAGARKDLAAEGMGNPADFLRMSQEAAAMRRPPSPQENINTGVQMMGLDKQGTLGLAQDAQMMKGVKFTVDPINDTAKYEGPAAVVRSLLESKKQVNQYQSLYNDLIAQNLKEQQQMREHPFANTLAELAASFARNDPNPYTRAIGQAATRLNPSMQELQGQEAGLLKSAEGFAARREAIDAGLMRSVELNEQKSQMNFTRLLSTYQQMSKGGMKDEKAYLAAARKLGIDDETAKDLASGFVKEAVDADTVRQAHQTFIKEQKDADRQSREKIATATRAVQMARVEILRSKAKLEAQFQLGEKVNVQKLGEERRRLLALRAQLEEHALRNFSSVQRSIGEIKTKYLGVSALDREGRFEGEINASIAPMVSSAEAGISTAQQHIDTIDQMIAELDARMPDRTPPGMAASHGPTGAAAPKKPDVFKSFKPGSTSSGIPTDPAFKTAFDKLDEGKIMKNPTTGQRIRKVNGKPVIVSE